MIYFDDFRREFDINNPDQFLQKIKMFRSYLERIEQEFDDTWTYCTGCHTYIRKTDVTIKQEETTTGSWVIKCKHCGTPWFVRSKDPKGVCP